MTSPRVAVIHHRDGGNMVQEIDWLPEWPLPRTGEAVIMKEDFGGVVERVEFHVAAKRIELHLR